jgi:hypothetical protein
VTTSPETPDARIGELKELERRRGELLLTARTTARDAALDALSALQRRLVHAMSDARRTD